MGERFAAYARVGVARGRGSSVGDEERDQPSRFTARATMTPVVMSAATP
jgi:hypothetical protein